MPALQSHANRAASMILREGLVPQWMTGGILPCEMAFFLGACGAEGLESIIESGRQDGYSTRVLGHWARQENVSVASIDAEIDAERAARCRAVLANLPIALVKGNACAEIGRLTKAAYPKPTALLIDGPKGSLAAALAAASASDNLRVIAFHNMLSRRPSAIWLTPFGLTYYEKAIDPSDGAFGELRASEQANPVIAANAHSITKSGLGVVVLNEESRRAMRRAVAAQFGLVQPPIVRALWGLGAFDRVTWLNGVSSRTLSRPRF